MLIRDGKIAVLNTENDRIINFVVTYIGKAVIVSLNHKGGHGTSPTVAK